ncbi:MAG TPA: hypothetical protein VKM55_04685 [Candidatus Lokiarchaeia archaeon]|nr:hypothetical protein [Candidatus Lokiarchaeia archaeon]
MSLDMKSVMIKCPSCNRDIELELPSQLVLNASKHILGIHVPKERCCSEHSFMVFFDKNLKIMGYENADIEFDLKKKPSKQSSDESSSFFDVKVLINAIGIKIVSMMLRALLVHKPIYFIDAFDINDYARKSITFLDEIKSEDVMITTGMIDEKELTTPTLEAADPLVCAMHYNAILRTPFAAAIRTALEGSLLKETVNIPDREGQVAFLRRELAKVSKIIDDLAAMLKTTEFYYEEDIPTFLKKKFNYKVKHNIIDCFKEILESRFGDDVTGKIKSKLANSLGFTR